MAETAGDHRAERRPAWLRKSRAASAAVVDLERRIRTLGLHTVCQSARCPNAGECFAAGTATFMILGDRCTRGCAFCAVGGDGPLEPPDPEEGIRIAEFLRATGGIRYAVVTSVTRDDLPDGGAGHFARVASDLKRELPGIRLEVLVPDFGGVLACVGTVCAAPIDMFGHNMETVERMYAAARPGATYGRSLGVLEAAKQRGGRLIKTGIMVGLGETLEELTALFGHLVAAGVDILTIGQYLRPTSRNLAVVRYYRPEEFAGLRGAALASGLPVVVAGPYVRSSYLAEEAFLARNGPFRLDAGKGEEKGV